MMRAARIDLCHVNSSGYGQRGKVVSKTPSLEEYDNLPSLLNAWTGGVFENEGWSLQNSATYAVRKMGFGK